MFPNTHTHTHTQGLYDREGTYFDTVWSVKYVGTYISDESVSYEMLLHFLKTPLQIYTLLSGTLEIRRAA